MSDFFQEIVDVIRRLALGGDFPSDLLTLHITPQTLVEELGLDSMGELALMIEVTNLSGKYLPDAFLHENMSVGDLAAIVETTSAETEESSK
jgi:acyl carrier protein